MRHSLFYPLLLLCTAQMMQSRGPRSHQNFVTAVDYLLARNFLSVFVGESFTRTAPAFFFLFLHLSQESFHREFRHVSVRARFSHLDKELARDELS